MISLFFWVLLELTHVWNIKWAAPRTPPRKWGTAFLAASPLRVFFGTNKILLQCGAPQL